MPLVDFIKKHLGASPRKSEKTRQSTLIPWVSRSDAGKETPNESSTPPSLTTSSSVTEGSSEPAEDLVPVGRGKVNNTVLNDSAEDIKTTQPAEVTVLEPLPAEERSVPLEGEMTVDQVADLHGSIEDGSPLPEEEATFNVEMESMPSEEEATVDARNDSMISGEGTTDDAGNESQQDVIRDSLEGLNPNWELDAMPGDALDLGDDLDLAYQDDTEEQSQSSGSTHPNKIKEATTTIVAKAKSFLGKRKRIETDAVSSEQKDKSESKRSSLRSRDIKSTDVDDEPTSKRLRKSEIAVTTTAFSSISTTQRKSRKKSHKIWLRQGLYVGQDPDFDPRLTESKNKKKKQQMASPPSDAKKVNSLLPPPMFAGQRLLDQGRNFKLPYDVCSPLPPGQPKPDDWKKTSKSKVICTF